VTRQAGQIVEHFLANPAGVQEVVQRDVPLLAADWGVKDEDALVHTLGINLLGSLGRAAGYIGLVEYPVPRAQRWQQKLVRVDAAWIDRQARRLAVLAEFERFSLDTALEKQTNLYVAAHGCEVPPEVLLLCVWAVDGMAVDISWCKTDGSLPVPGGPTVTRPAGSQFFLAHAVFGRRGEQLHFLRLRRLM
jgi:hypothetical protein